MVAVLVEVDVVEGSVTVVVVSAVTSPVVDVMVVLVPAYTVQLSESTVVTMLAETAFKPTHANELSSYWTKRALHKEFVEHKYKQLQRKVSSVVSRGVSKLTNTCALSSPALAYPAPPEVVLEKSSVALTQA